jgi:peptidyl-prolyl cis-trans isomerase C
MGKTPPCTSRSRDLPWSALASPAVLLCAIAWSAACGGGGQSKAVQTDTPQVQIENVPEEHLSPVVAVVNNVKVYKTTYEELVQMLRSRIVAGDPDSVERYIEAKDRGLEKAIDGELLYQEAVRKGYGISSEELRQEYASRVKRAPSEKAFLSIAQSRFLSKSEVLDLIRREIALNRYIKAELEPRLTATDEEVRGYYDTRPDLFTPDAWVKLGQIFVAAPIEWEVSKRNAALAIITGSLEKIRRGQSFESVAREDSQDAVSAQVGGLIGLFKKGNLPEKLDRAAFALQPGEISDIVENDDGYHLLKLYDRQGGQLEPFDKVREDAKARLLAKKRSDLLAGVVSGLKASATIERIAS